jgi:ATP/maltotriose-dependent transcriptional regulator MalT
VCGRAWIAAAVVTISVAACGSVPPLVESDVRRDLVVDLNHRAGRAVARGELARAIALYREALRLSAALEDFRATAANALSLAALLQATGDYARAREALELILTAPENFEPRFVAEAAGRNAALALQERRFDAAAEWLDRAERACPQPGCSIQVALLNMRSQLLFERGEPEHAAALLERALVASRAAGDREEEANSLRLMGRIRSHGGDHAGGAALVQRALETDKQLARPGKIAFDLLVLADIELKQGRREAAHQYAYRSLVVSRAVRNRKAEEAAREMLERTR